MVPDALTALPGRIAGAVRSAPRPVLWVFAAGIALRAALLASYRPGFAGYPDSAVFAAAAGGDLYESVYRTAGYPLFLRWMHALSDELTFTILVQHALGVASAALLYLAVRRLAAGVWPALLPAIVVLFGGTQLYLEHALLSEALFVFLVSAGLYCAIRAQATQRMLPWVAGAAALVGVAAVVRPAGLLLPVLLAAWALWLPRLRGARRAVVACAALAIGLAPVAAYVVAQERATGFTGLAQADGWTLYARVAEFADCSHFDPPSGTRALCEQTPSRDRHSANSYLYDNGISPARRLYGEAPDGDEDLARFARTAIAAQPLDYARTVLRDVLRAASPDSWHRPGMGNQTAAIVNYLHALEGEDDALRPISAYWDTAGYARKRIRAFDAYANAARVEGPLTAVLAILAALGIALSRGLARRGAALLALAGLALLLAPAATLFYDVRYATTAYPPLAAAAALGVQALLGRVRVPGGKEDAVYAVPSQETRI